VSNPFISNGNTTTKCPFISNGNTTTKCPFISNGNTTTKCPFISNGNTTKKNGTVNCRYNGNMSSGCGVEVRINVTVRVRPGWGKS
jgi:hypothetical protein